MNITLEDSFNFIQDKNGVIMLRNKYIPMMDWDWPNSGHKTEDCLTINCLMDVIKQLKDYLKRYPNQVIRIYVTPGGIRAFFLGKAQTVEEFFTAGGGETINGDPMYINLCKRVGRFGSRITPKVNRENDFVAIYLCTLGNSNHQNEDLLSLLKYTHDDPIHKFNKDLMNINKPRINKATEDIDFLSKVFKKRLKATKDVKLLYQHFYFMCVVLSSLK